MRARISRDRGGLLAPQAHEHARHQREVEAHVALVAVAEVLDDVLGPLVGLGQQHLAGELVVDLLAEPAQVVVGLRQVLAVGAVAFEQVRHGVEAEPVQAEAQPVEHHVEHGLLDLGVVVVEVGLVVEEPVPVVLLALRRPRSSCDVSVSVKMMRASDQRWSSSPHTYQSALGLVRSWRDSRNHGCWSEVWFITMSAITRMPRRCASSMSVGGVLRGAEVGVHGEEVRDVVAAVLERRRVERQQPQAVDAQPLQVVELLGQAPEVAVAVAVGVVEAPHEHLVEDGPPEPVGVRDGQGAGGGGLQHDAPSVPARPDPQVRVTRDMRRGW